MSIPPKSAIAVFGAGSWGTALAVLLARNGHGVTLWGHDAAHMARVARDRGNSAFLPGIAFPENLAVSDDLQSLASSVQCCLLVVPSHAFRAVLTALQPHLSRDAVVAWATKGLDAGTGKLLSQVGDEILGVFDGLAVERDQHVAHEQARGVGGTVLRHLADQQPKAL